MKLERIPETLSDLLDERVLSTFQLSGENYQRALEQIDYNWVCQFGIVGRKYAVLISPVINAFASSPAEWTAVGSELASITRLTWGNGSYSFISCAVPALVEADLVTTTEELLQGAQYLAKADDPNIRRGHLYDVLAGRIARGAIRGFNDLQHPERYRVQLSFIDRVRAKLSGGLQLAHR